jgi:hypothetical protein
MAKTAKTLHIGRAEFLRRKPPRGRHPKLKQRTTLGDTLEFVQSIANYRGNFLWGILVVASEVGISEAPVCATSRLLNGDLDGLFMAP